MFLDIKLKLQGVDYYVTPGLSIEGLNCSNTSRKHRWKLGCAPGDNTI